MLFVLNLPFPNYYNQIDVCVFISKFLMARLQMFNCASSSSSSHKRHDVFLSFRGEDTRDNFLSHLYDALIQKKIETYIDYRLEKGDEISESLIQAIKESHVSIVIFSEKYATSKWCLDEISEIIECKEEQGQIVIPVFYKVDPSHVRKQRGTFEEAFAQHERDLKSTIEKVQKWRDALTKAANLAGYDSTTYRTEAAFIKDIVKDVLQKLNLIYPVELKGLIGIEENYANVESLLEIGSSETRVIGIWGMGGIGKTTLANALHAKLSSQFEGHCFLESVREQSEKYGIDVLRNKLFSELLEEEILHAYVSNVGSHFITRRLRRKKVFTVLDDVATSEQLEDLISDYACLGPGSRVIVTTRDKHIFNHVDEIYEVKELNVHDSLQLFCLNAFRVKHPKNGYEELSESVIAYCKGNPLALKILGARLRSRSEEAWKSELRKLQKIPNVKIHNVLKLSFDDLDCTEQDIFLDIACFLKGEYRDHIISLLEAYNFFPAMGMEVLVDKSLITVSRHDKIEMHDLVQEMGWNIVHQESIKDPGRRSRLWEPDEVYDLLKYNKGTEAIEGMMLDVSKIEDLHVSFNSFTKMTKIRFLKLYDRDWSGRCKIYLPKNGLESLSDKLRYLEWHGYCSKSLPSSFSGELLVEISMHNSNLEKLWDGVQNLGSLKKIDLSYSKNLVEVPDLSMAANLKQLYLLNCESLRQVHPSILSLQELQTLYLNDCTEIESLQSDVHLRSLQHLHLTNCSSLKEFSVSSVELEELWLDGTSIQELPSSICRCAKLKLINAENCDNLDIVGEKLSDDLKTSLRTLYLTGCKQLNASNLRVVLDGLRSLTCLQLGNCYNLETLPENIGLLSSLDNLTLSGSNIESLPANIKNLLRLSYLDLDNCRKLVSLPELPQSLCVLRAVNCTSLVTNFTQLNISFDSFQLKHEFYGGYQSYFLPGALVPDMFNFRAGGTLVTISHLPHSGLCGFISYVILSQSPPNVTYWNLGSSIDINSKRVNTVYAFLNVRSLISDHVFLWYIDVNDVKIFRDDGAHDPSRISFEFFHIEGTKISTEGIKGCGVYPIYASENGYSFKQNGMKLEFGDSSRDIVELEPNSSHDIDELQHGGIGFEYKGSNHDNENGQTKKLKQAMHQTSTTSVQHVKVDSNENSSCHSFSVSTASGTKRKPKSFNEEDYSISSIPENQVIPFDTPSVSHINSNQTIEELEEKDLTNYQVHKSSEPVVMLEKAHTLVENDNPHLEPDWDPIAELESMLCDSYKSSLISTHSTTDSETEVLGPNVAAILDNLEILLETSLEIIFSDVEIKQQLHQIFEQLVQVEDQVPFKLHPVIYMLKTFIENVDVTFATTQKTIQDYDQLLQSRSLLSKQLESAKERQDQINSKFSKGKIQYEKINAEIFELEKKLSVLVETREKLRRALDYCDVENNKLKTQVAKLVPECKTIITALKESETCYKVALNNKKRAEDEWADLKKTFVANKI